jgi:outer membrane PBP1 activator LpoA protein
VLLVAACATGPGSQTSQVRAQLRAAGEYYADGNWSAAAELFTRAAEQQQQPGFSRSMLRAADARVLAKQWQQARLDSNRVSEADLSRPNLAWLQLVRAELALRRGDLEAAELLLMQLATLPNHLYPRLEVLSQSLESQKRAPETLAVMRFRKAIKSTNNTAPGEIAAAFHGLDAVSNSRLMQTAANADDDLSLRGWLELVLLVRQRLFSNAQLQDDITAWKTVNEFHPLSGELALRVARRYSGSFKSPRMIAVFLPVNGRYAPAAAAVRDGILNAYLEQAGGRHSTLRFYPVDGPEHVARAYIDAREDGVDWIIGPLDRESVQALLELPGFNIPTLLLNHATDITNVDLAQIDQLFSFALLPEDEARQMAELAALQGFSTSAILAPDSSWGDRIAEQFAEHFTASGGEILQESRYTSDQTDYSQVLRHMLKIDESEARHRSLQTVLRQPLGFEAQRRDDLDVIFLAARPRQGRLIKPQLRFFDAGEIPVYATSQLYSGKPDSRADRDLNNVLLPFPPILLTRATGEDSSAAPEEASSRRQGQMDAFFGLGADAIGLLPYLELLTYNPGLAYPGKSGNLTVAGGGRIERNLLWGRFRNGRAEAWNPL